MLLLPSSSKRGRAFPLRVRYIVLVALVFSLYYFYTPGRRVSAPSRQQVADKPRPVHTVYDADEDSFNENSPLWDDKASFHGDVPVAAPTAEQQHANDLMGAALLNDPTRGADSQAEAAVPGDAPFVDGTGAAADAKLVEGALGSSNVMNEDIAEILRLHDSSDMTDPLKDKPIDKKLLEKLEQAKSVAAAAMADVANSLEESAPEEVAPATAESPSKVEDAAAALSLSSAAEAADVNKEIVAVPAGSAGGVPGLTTATNPQGVFKDFDFLFAFGDSWSYTAFELSGPQPSPANPLGNPALPVNGVTPPPEWLYYLTTTYNESYLRTYNIARGAATIDRLVVPPHPNFAFTWTFREQAADAFGLTYSRPTPDIPWATANALFAVWFGVVDLALLLEREEWSEGANVRNLASYAQTLETLYGFGARRFLLLNCPPLALMPGAQNTEVSVPAVKDFNDRLKGMQKAFMAKHSTDIEAEMFLFDVHGLLSGIIEDPALTPQTTGLKNTTENCWNYNPDANPQTQPWDRLDPECGIPYNQYFWANPLHPTYPVHEAIAARIVSDCFAVKGQVSGFCS